MSLVSDSETGCRTEWLLLASVDGAIKPVAQVVDVDSLHVWVIVSFARAASLP